VTYTGSLGNQTLATSNFSSTDTKFHGKATADVFFNIVQPGFVVSATSLTVAESGSTASFTVRLSAPPTSNVTINIVSTNTNEVTIVSGATLTFTPANWNTNQTVTVQGVDDGNFDGDQTITVDLQPAISADPAYNNLDPPNVNVTNIDND
jgi:hypothetical protein